MTAFTIHGRCAGRRTGRHGRSGVSASLLFAATLVASALTVLAPGRAAAEIPPLTACTSLNVGEIELETFVDGTEDYIVWTCTKAKTTPVLYYWKHSVHSLDPEDELKRTIKGAFKTFFKENVWQGVVQGGFGWFPATANHRAHIRLVGAFDLRSWAGTPLNREMGVHLVLKHTLDQGVTWTTCADTGWKNLSSPNSQVSYEFWRLTTDCPGGVQLYTQAHFLQISTNTWYTSPFIASGPFIPGT